MPVIVTKMNRENNHRFYRCACVTCSASNTIAILDTDPVLPVKNGDTVETRSPGNFAILVCREFDSSYYCVCGGKQFSILSELNRIVSLSDLVEPYLDEAEISFSIGAEHDTYRVEIEYDGEDTIIKADEIHYLVFSLPVIVEMQHLAKARYLAVQSGEYENSEDGDDVEAFYDEDTDMWG